MKKRMSVFALVAVATASSVLAGPHSTAAFKKLQALAGEWEGADEKRKAVKTNLLQRRARKSGSLLSAAINRFFPAMIPACGPPNNLSPLKQTRSAPSFKTSTGVGS